MHIINTDTIVLARDLRGVSQYQLAESIGMSPTNLSKIERSEIGVQPEWLQKISEVTALPLQFFYQQPTALQRQDIFRKRQKVPQKLLDSILARGEVIYRHLQLLQKALQLPAPLLPPVCDDASMAAAMAELLELGAPAEKLLRPIESLGIVVCHWDFGSERIDSFSLFEPGGIPLICLNNKLKGDRQRFSLAFELGRICGAADANIFAASLLMPEAIIRPDMEAGISLQLLKALKRKWKLSMIALLYRADDLGLVTPNQKRYLLQQFNQLCIRRNEPAELDIAPEKPTLLKHLLGRLAQKQKLGVAALAESLCLHVEEYVEFYG